MLATLSMKKVLHVKELLPDRLLIFSRDGKTNVRRRVNHMTSQILLCQRPCKASTTYFYTILLYRKGS
jgi:hypothetical protein